MSIVTVKTAINLFCDLAAAAGFNVLHEPSQQHFGSSVTWINNGEAQLRLVWDGKAEFLFLQVSHGLAGASQSDWLELFGSKCICGSFRDPEQPEVRFLRSVEYGLELMHPGASQ